ncbi:hypothetical protein HMI54_011031 [Coelomomyces lativittatus]|nr:hypothetical protein HMI56_007008 [Coelomomyces lativittatus]KAJ1512212.1 hypothetical protein HMI55_006311 [Coelomomyces lativittatus]KAJ1516053.1 hypothetical protein HMI54_011031 [Coelomomyces lativittatus]
MDQIKMDHAQLKEFNEMKIQLHLERWQQIQLEKFLLSYCLEIEEKLHSLESHVLTQRRTIPINEIKSSSSTFLASTTSSSLTKHGNVKEIVNVGIVNQSNGNGAHLKEKWEFNPSLHLESQAMASFNNSTNPSMGDAQWNTVIGSLEFIALRLTLLQQLLLSFPSPSSWTTTTTTTSSSSSLSSSSLASKLSSSIHTQLTPRLSKLRTLCQRMCLQHWVHSLQSTLPVPSSTTSSKPTSLLTHLNERPPLPPKPICASMLRTFLYLEAWSTCVVSYLTHTVDALLPTIPFHVVPWSCWLVELKQQLLFGPLRWLPHFRNKSISIHCLHQLTVPLFLRVMEELLNVSLPSLANKMMSEMTSSTTTSLEKNGRGAPHGSTKGKGNPSYASHLPLDKSPRPSSSSSRFQNEETTLMSSNTLDTTYAWKDDVLALHSFLCWWCEALHFNTTSLNHEVSSSSSSTSNPEVSGTLPKPVFQSLRTLWSKLPTSLYFQLSLQPWFSPNLEEEIQHLQDDEDQTENEEGVGPKEVGNENEGVEETQANPPIKSGKLAQKNSKLVLPTYLDPSSSMALSRFLSFLHHIQGYWDVPGLRHRVFKVLCQAHQQWYHYLSTLIHQIKNDTVPSTTTTTSTTFTTPTLIQLKNTKKSTPSGSIQHRPSYSQESWITQYFLLLEACNEGLKSLAPWYPNAFPKSVDVFQVMKWVPPILQVMLPRTLDACSPILKLIKSMTASFRARQKTPMMTWMASISMKNVDTSSAETTTTTTTSPTPTTTALSYPPQATLPLSSEENPSLLLDPLTSHPKPTLETVATRPSPSTATFTSILTPAPTTLMRLGYSTTPSYFLTSLWQPVIDQCDRLPRLFHAMYFDQCLPAIVQVYLEELQDLYRILRNTERSAKLKLTKTPFLSQTTHATMGVKKSRKRGLRQSTPPSYPSRMDVKPLGSSNHEKTPLLPSNEKQTLPPRSVESLNDEGSMKRNAFEDQTKSLLVHDAKENTGEEAEAEDDGGEDVDEGLDEEEDEVELDDDHEKENRSKVVVSDEMKIRHQCYIDVVHVQQALVQQVGVDEELAKKYMAPLMEFTLPYAYVLKA